MHFSILPDSPAAQPLAERLTAAPGTQVVAHASGRPWIAGRWAAEDLILVTAGARQLALLGYATADEGAVRRSLASARSLGELDAVARTVAGSFHLTASLDGRTRVQGSVSTARQVFHAEAHGVTVAADGPGALAELLGAHPDEEVLALRMVTPSPPWPLSLRPVWSGVEALDVGARLELGPDGRSRVVRWWQAPEPEAELPQAAEAVRSALSDTIAARARGTISADLSGGMDSTSLCFVADAVGADLVTHHWKPLDRANDDTTWAERAASHLPSARHRFVSTADSPTWYEADAAGGTAHGEDEGPLPWARNRAHMERLVADVAAEGSSVHLLGVGGDELFGALPTAPWSLVRSHPLTSLPTIQRFRVLNRWSPGSTLRGLADNRSYPTWLRSAAGRLTAPAPGPTDALLGWGWEPRMPPWATPDAVETVRRTLRRAAEDGPRPHHRDRAQHQTLDCVVLSGGGIRQLGAAMRASGVACEAPYLDDRVIEAALSVRMRDRLVSGRFKPVLATAMRGVVPDEILARRSKGEFSAEAFQGLRRNRARLLELCDDLHLSRLGLVDPAALRRALLGPTPESRHLVPFENTLACESWLRSPRATAPGSAMAGGPR
ncbi:asparagine synthase-related protein [Wenjunlia tyrosinilytica]|uniref:Asparagine synthase n=1 Tax=Wenjunlia tyrosinilytica TaxID=1544741 RepID=A0A917ZPF3_9ACTN|nr:asparagine synthase-related protein [Wenjunlia tyrosinilytica]GGO87590.1 asparagine synthase [Wenjunlia tyrosinilytica]